LTGDNLAKATAAAKAAVLVPPSTGLNPTPTARSTRVHMTKSDGSQVTVKLDAAFKVTGTETGGSGGRVVMAGADLTRQTASQRPP